MRPVLFLLLGAHLACAETHSHHFFITATSGIADFPEFVALAMVDGQQINYYDSKNREVVPKQEWVKGAVDPDFWNRNTQILTGTESSFKINIGVVKERFNQSGGVHTNQRMYGCEWDDETGATNGFFQDGFDGEDFLHLELKEMRWISPVQQGFSTIQKWNKDTPQLEMYKQYFSTECIEWLKKYLQYGKSSLQKTVSPQVSLLQKDPSSPVSCHATGFYPSGVKISWMRNDEDHDEDVDLSELLPNEDGTFQRSSTITVTTDERKNNQFSCVVEHQGKTIREILKDDSLPIGIIVGVVVAVLLLVVIGVVVFKVYQKNKGFKPVNASDDGSNSSAHSDPKA